MNESTVNSPIGNVARKPEITVVICTYNRYDVLPDAIASLEMQTADAAAIEILVVDNSGDEASQTTHWAQHVVPANARLIIDTVPGLSRARNSALREARAGIIGFIDDDAIAVPGWCEAILATFREHGNAGSAGGPVEPIWPAVSPPWLHRIHRGYYSIVDLGDEPRALRKKEWLAGTNIAYRKSVLEEAGGFNEGIGRIGETLMSNEELVVSAKISTLGYESWYAPDARVLHRIREDRVSQKWLRRRRSWQVVSDLLANPQNTSAEECWARLAKYQSALPVEMRGIRGLFLDSADPEVFYEQTLALEAVLTLALNYGQDPERE